MTRLRFVVLAVAVLLALSVAPMFASDSSSRPCGATLNLPDVPGISYFAVVRQTDTPLYTNAGLDRVKTKTRVIYIYESRPAAAGGREVKLVDAIAIHYAPEVEAQVDEMVAEFLRPDPGDETEDGDNTYVIPPLDLVAKDHTRRQPSEVEDAFNVMGLLQQMANEAYDRRMSKVRGPSIVHRDVIRWIDSRGGWATVHVCV